MHIANTQLPDKGLVLVFGSPGSGKSSRIANPLIIQARKSGRPLLVVDPADLRKYGPSAFSPESFQAAVEANLVVLLLGYVELLPDSYRDFALKKACAVVVLKTGCEKIAEWIWNIQLPKLWGIFSRNLPDPSELGEGYSRVVKGILCSRSQTGQSVFCERSWDECRIVKLPMVPDHAI